MEKRMISPKQAAETFGLNEGTLANWRSQKRGPKYYKVGRLVKYRLEDVEAWVNKHPVLTVDSLGEE